MKIKADATITVDFELFKVLLHNSIRNFGLNKQNYGSDHPNLAITDAEYRYQVDLAARYIVNLLPVSIGQ